MPTATQSNRGRQPASPRTLPHDPSDVLWTVAEVAAYLQVPVKTLYVWRSRRQGPPGVRVGRWVRYWRSHVIAWLDEQIAEQGGTQPRTGGRL